LAPFLGDHYLDFQSHEKYASHKNDQEIKSLNNALFNRKSPIQRIFALNGPVEIICIEALSHTHTHTHPSLLSQVFLLSLFSPETTSLKPFNRDKHTEAKTTKRRHRN
jgi:hypothetical protein